MSSRFRSTYILLAIFVVLLAVVIFFANSGAKKSRQMKGADKLLYSASEVDSLTGLRISKGEEEPIALQKLEKGWMIEDYLVDPDEVEGLLMALQEVTRGKEVSRNEANWEKFGLSDASGLKLMLLQGADETDRMVIGSAAAGAGKYYVRRNDNPAVYEVSTTVERFLRYDLNRWRDKRLFPINPDEVMSLSVQIGEESWEIPEASEVWEEQSEKLDFYLEDIASLKAAGIETDMSLFVTADQFLRIQLADGTELTTEIDVVDEGQSYARLQGREELLRIPADYGIRLRPTFIDGGDQEANSEDVTPELELNLDDALLEADLN